MHSWTHLQKPPHVKAIQPNALNGNLQAQHGLLRVAEVPNSEAKELSATLFSIDSDGRTVVNGTQMRLVQ